jgi:hypothetical protein
MNKTMNKTIVALAIAALASPLFAQKPAEVTIKQVNDRRTSGTFFAELTISLELPKVRAMDVAAARVLVASAVDNAGNSLVDDKAEQQELMLTPRMGMGNEDSAVPASVSVKLKNPDRKATSVKEVKGEIELYMPSKDPNSIAEIPKFLSFSGKPLAHKALKANGVEITLVTPAQLEAEKKRLGDAKRKEAKESGYEGEDLDNVVKYYLESLFTVEEGDVLVRLKDPNKRIQDVRYLAAGEEKTVSLRDEQGFVLLSSWGDKPQPDWGLRIAMTTPKNLVRQAFSLTNVPLP